MKKAFRLTIDFNVEIKECIQGVKNKKVEEFTREIVNCFLSDPQMLSEFVKYIFYCRHLYYDDPEIGIGKALGLKTEDEIFINLLTKVSNETSFYLKTLCYPEYRDFEYEGKDGTALDLILAHFPYFHVFNGVLTGIGDEENIEDDCLVPEEAVIAVTGHDEARAGEG